MTNRRIGFLKTGVPSNIIKFTFAFKIKKISPGLGNLPLVTATEVGPVRR